ncbi:MAG TPA: hypothetical protein VJK02_13400 [Anaerolineales bacterium]|nr:hypothetical protein [Anaerolineales bacterium]
MELATFGAILGFALDLEEQRASFYEASAQGDVPALFEELTRGARKRLARLERTRREGVAEMILEPISGLLADQYQPDVTPSGDQAGLLQQAIALEETVLRFYRQAADKMPVREVARTFSRFAEETERHLQDLQAHQS